MGTALAELSPLFLYLLPGGPRNDRLMHICEDGPVFPVVFKTALVLVGFGVGLEVEDIAAILLKGQDFGNGRAVPMTGAVLGWFPGSLYPFGLPVVTWGQDFLLREGAGDLLHAHRVQAHTVDPPHHSGGRLVNDPPLGVVRVFLIPIGRLAHRFAGITLDLVADAPLFADVAGVPFIEQIFYRSKLALALVCVNAVRHGHQPDVMLREKFFRQPPDLDVVSPQAGEVFDEYRRRFPLLNLLEHGGKAGAVHRHAGNAVIKEVDQIGIAFFLGYLDEQLFLVLDAITIAIQIIIAGKALIEERRILAAFSVLLQ